MLVLMKSCRYGASHWYFFHRTRHFIPVITLVALFVLLFCPRVHLQWRLMSKIMYDIVVVLLVDNPSCYVRLYSYYLSSPYPYYSVLVYENDKRISSIIRTRNMRFSTSLISIILRPSSEKPINFHCLCKWWIIEIKSHSNNDSFLLLVTKTIFRSVC